MSLLRLSPSTRSLSRWPNFWDDDDLLTMSDSQTGLDLFETEDEVVVRANIAGVSSQDVDLTYEKGVLWIKAEKSSEEKTDDKQFYSRSNWSYSYKVAVPGMLDHSVEPEAEIENGVLSVTFKKAEASKPKKLSIKSK